MSKAALSLLSRLPPQQEPAAIPLGEAIKPGKLVELSGDASVACTTTAVNVVLFAQHEGETTAWIQPRGGLLFPPDLRQCGVDLDALIVIHVPESAGPTGPCRAAELLLRSGAFGLIVIDLRSAAPVPGRAWQGRLLGLARQHHSRVVVLTEQPTHHESLGTLVALRIEPRRIRRATAQFDVEHHVLKNKSGAPVDIEAEARRGPWGLS